MPVLDDHPALRRLASLDARPEPIAAPLRMGYQPSLDGLRAVSVVAVILYHAGFSWMHGGFFGVEVFFVVSGFLITSLLIDERESSGRVRLGEFWKRRARRLLPALLAMLLAVGTWAAMFGGAEQQSQLRRDFPWALFYGGNWGTIFGKTPYFAPSSPPLLRHVWSLAVEEQWYLLWPLGFVVLVAWPASGRRRGQLLVGVSLAVMVLTWWMARFADLGAHPVHLLNPFAGRMQTVDRTNFLYLSTITRSSGLLLGAGCAFLWRPWRGDAAPARGGRALDVAAGVAVAGLVAAFLTADLVDRSVYRWVLPAVTVLSAIAVCAVVHPSAARARAALSARPLVELGKRSYGLYVWSWPVMVIAGARRGQWGPFVAAMAVAAVLSELCYRHIETPIRRGGVQRWMGRVGRQRFLASAGVIALAALIPLVAFYASVHRFDRASGGADVIFDIAAGAGPAAAEPAVSAPPVAATAAPTSAAVAPVGTTTPAPPRLPRRVVLVGDSTAHALVVNAPRGIEQTFTLVDGSVEGCGVFDRGIVTSARPSFEHDLDGCAGWQDKWAAAARRAQAQIVLVSIGAWDVFDITVGGQRMAFGSRQFDTAFRTNLTAGVDAVLRTGARVALLEVPCMRPVKAAGAAVPPLPERGDDERPAHLNRLMRQVADADPVHVTFVSGPAAWCHDESIAGDTAYRWDGVHVYKPGAKLVFETIAGALLAIPLG